MNNKAAFGKEKAITLYFEGGINHCLLSFRAQLGQFIGIAPCICTVGHAEWETELELRQDLSAEEMFLNQS